MQFTTILSILAVAASAVTAVPTISEEYQVAARARFSELQSRGITVKRDGSLDVRACIHEADEATGMDACDVCYAQNMDGGCGSTDNYAQFGCEMGNMAYCATMCC